MSLLTGLFESTNNSSEMLLHAMVNAFKKVPKYGGLSVDNSLNWFHTVKLDLLGFDGWQISATYVENTASTAGRGKALYLLPPGFTLHSPNIATSQPIKTCMDTDPSNLGYGRDYGGFAKCLIAYDEVEGEICSLLIALYGGSSPSVGLNDILYKNSYGESYGPAIVFLAKDVNGDIFGGGGCSDFVLSSGGTSIHYDMPVDMIFGKNGELDANVSVGGSYANLSVVAPFKPNTNCNNRGMLYLTRMINFTSDNLAPAKSMMMGVAVPTKTPSDSSKFGISYEIGGKKFINFGNLGAQSSRSPLIDPWCPF